MGGSTYENVILIADWTNSGQIKLIMGNVFVGVT